MLPRAFGWIALLLVLSLSTAGAASRCKLLMTPQLPVRMDNLRPVITASINGVDAEFIMDTGSFFDFLSPAAAAEFKLPLSDAPYGYYVSGIGGSVIPRIATARTFTVAGFSVRDALFLVGNNDFQGSEAGLLGQNLFRIADDDLDFANGAFRFVKPDHCRGQVLAYWATTQPIGVVDLHWTSQQRPHLLGEASVNGRSIEVLFDTGSPRTILSLHAAKRVGITPDTPGVIAAGVTGGLGSNSIRVWIAPIDKFEIGGETIEHTHVLIGDIDLTGLDADMLLGTDFFLAHHVYVATSQDKLYFTYNGGPVFDLNARRPAQIAGASKPQGVSSPPSTPSSGTTSPAGPSTAAGPAVPSNAPTDASGFMRRGMAESARSEYPQAITDLTRACSLDPTNADCRYQRGLAYWHSAQGQSALADFDSAIRLRSDDFDAYLARAQFEMSRQHDRAETDLDAVDHFAPQQADLRLRLARLYGAAGEYAGAVHQYDLWIDYHARDIRLPYALSGRCGSEAAANVDVDRALADCNRALQLMDKSAPAIASAVATSNRGMVYLRQGRLDEALADFDAALKLQPKLPIARYARGLVELKKGMDGQGQTDLAAAEAQQPGLAKRLAAVGLKP
jgi:tetratricopeptide (TPR) repeat protein